MKVKFHQVLLRDVPPDLSLTPLTWNVPCWLDVKVCSFWPVVRPIWLMLLACIGVYPLHSSSSTQPAGIVSIPPVHQTRAALAPDEVGINGASIAFSALISSLSGCKLPPPPPDCCPCGMMVISSPD